MLGYIYCITNNITGETYIGRRNYYKEDWLKYMGSGKLITKAVKKYGKENFSKDFIEEHSTNKELMHRESYWIKHYKSIGKAEYNISLSGGVCSGNYWINMTPEESRLAKENLSNSIKNSKSHKDSIERRMKAKENERKKLIEKHTDEVVSLYKEGYSMNKIKSKLKLTGLVVRKILVENNAVNLNNEGRIIVKHTEETKKRISKTLTNTDNKNVRSCIQCGSFTSNKKYCSQMCYYNAKANYDCELVDNQETYDKIRELYIQGNSLRSIGRTYGIDHKRVHKIVTNTCKINPDF